MEVEALERPTPPDVSPPGPGEAWTVMHMVRWSAAYLEAKGVDSPRLTGELLLAHSLGVERLQLYLQFDRPLTPAELAGYKPLLRRRADREPLQYIVGSTPFRSLDLVVDRRGLIPRPETEYLVDVLRQAAGVGRRFERALDVGTGSGALALSLVAEEIAASALAVDISADAIGLARENAARNGLRDRVEFRQGDLGAAWGGRSFGLVVANLPYVPEAEWQETAPEVRDWEPPVALRGGRDGLDVVRPFLAAAPACVESGGWLALELASGQTGSVADELLSSGAFDDVRVRDDLTERARYVLARRS
jgi:release factor glutamine methyltransferase